MYLPVEVIAIVISAAGILVALGGGLFAGFAWMLRRMDERFDKGDDKFENVHENFGKISAQIGELRTELNEVKVPVTCLEGPQERLIFPR